MRLTHSRAAGRTHAHTHKHTHTHTHTYTNTHTRAHAHANPQQSQEKLTSKQRLVRAGHDARARHPSVLRAPRSRLARIHRPLTTASHAH